MITIDPEARYGERCGKDTDGLLRALRPFLRRARLAVPVGGQVSVLLTDDPAIRRLNRVFRGIDKATDVLSFPAHAVPAQKHSVRFRSIGHTAVPAVAGDLAISLDTAARQAARFGHPLLVELKILMLHGLLHLAGFDHETDAGEMAALEEQLRRRFRLPGALIARTLQGKSLHRPNRHSGRSLEKRTGRS